MKAKVIERIFGDMTNYQGEGLVEIHTNNQKMYTFNPRSESDDLYEVSVDDNIVIITNKLGTAWIDCDSITSIEI